MEVNTPGVDEKKAQDSLAPSVVNESSDNDLDPVELNKAFKLAARSSITMVCPCTLLYHIMSTEFVQTLIVMILIPLPLFGASTIYSVAGFTAWVLVAIIWTFYSVFAVVLYPLWESRAALMMIMRGLIKVISPCLRLPTHPTGLNGGINFQDIYARGTGKYVAPRSAEAKFETVA